MKFLRDNGILFVDEYISLAVIIKFVLYLTLKLYMKLTTFSRKELSEESKDGDMKE
jgi:hypothetical protein